MNMRPIAAALKRLAASDTPRKRSNALKAFAAAVKKLHADVAKEYPKLRKDGTAIVPRKARGAFCPACRVPMQSYVALVKHLFNTHHTRGGIVNDRVCFCGAQFDTRSRLARHLAGQENLGLHYAMSVLKKSAGVK